MVQGHNRHAIKTLFCYFSTKTYVVGTQKNHLNDHPKHMFKLMDMKKYKQEGPEVLDHLSHEEMMAAKFWNFW